MQQPRILNCPVWVIIGLVLAGTSQAQTSIEALEAALKNTRNKHEEIGRNLSSQFAADLDRALASPQAALEFYKANGGNFPDPPDELFQVLRKNRDKKGRADITAQYENESAFACLAYCKMLKFAFQSVNGKETADKSKVWREWLEENIPNFPTYHGSFLANVKIGDGPPVRAYKLGGLFRNKKEGDWTLESLPDLYREYVINGLAAEKSTKTAGAWDNYIAAMEVRSKNPERWQNVEAPRLAFQKYAGLFEMAPNDLDLTRMVEIIQSHLEHPDYGNMQKKAEEYLAVLKKTNKGG